jgi:hypothetical protein
LPELSGAEKPRDGERECQAYRCDLTSAQFKRPFSAYSAFRAPSW